MEPPWPGGWRYVIGALCGWMIFLLTMTEIAVGHGQSWPIQALVALALIPPLIVAFQFFWAYRLVAAEDEFVRALFAKRMLAAAAVTVVIATAWSAAEVAGAPHLPAWLLYPLVWGVFGLMTPIIKDARS